MKIGNQKILYSIRLRKAPEIINLSTLQPAYFKGTKKARDFSLPGLVSFPCFSISVSCPPTWNTPCPAEHNNFVNSDGPVMYRPVGHRYSCKFISTLIVLWKVFACQYYFLYQKQQLKIKLEIGYNSKSRRQGGNETKVNEPTMEQLKALIDEAIKEWPYQTIG